MTQLYVPPLRARFTLLEDWTFPLYPEYRNHTFMKFLGKGESYSFWVKDPITGESVKAPPVPVTIPKGTVMYIDRYYIKNGAGDYDSITFRAMYGKRTQRFWAKLKDANRIQAEFD